MAEYALTEAVKANDLALVRQLLEAGSDVNEGSDGLGRPLWWAAAKGHAEVACLLIDWGADLSLKTCGQTTYTMAQGSGNPALTSMIANAAQRPRRLPEPTGPVEKWVPMGAASVAFVGVYPALERKLTYIFNFEARERLLLCQDLKTRTEAVGPRTSFDELPPQVVETALEQFTRLGGKAERDYVLDGRSERSLGKTRRLPPQEPGHV